MRCINGLFGSVDFRGVNLASVSFMNSDLSAAMFDANTVFSFPNPNTFQQEGVNLSRHQCGARRRDRASGS